MLGVVDATGDAEVPGWGDATAEEGVAGVVGDRLGVWSAVGRPGDVACGKGCSGNRGAGRSGAVQAVATTIATRSPETRQI